MRHVIPLLVIFLSAVLLAAILLPADPWSNHFAFRIAAILTIGIPCYFYGISRGKASIGAAGRRPWLQYSLRTLLLVTTLLAVCLGLYCGRVREQREAVELLERIDGCRVEYDGYRGSVGEHRSRLIAWSEEFLGVDFVHGAVTVVINASDAGKALPQLKRLPYLQTVSVDLDDEPESFADQTEQAQKKNEAERERARTDVIAKLKAELPHAKVEAYVSIGLTCFLQ